MVSPEDVATTIAVMRVMKRFPRPRLADFVLANPTARVKDFCSEFLGGVVLKSSGGTRRAFCAIDFSLRRVRKELGIPPLQGHRPSGVPHDHAP